MHIDKLQVCVAMEFLMQFFASIFSKLGFSNFSHLNDHNSTSKDDRDIIFSPFELVFNDAFRYYNSGVFQKCDFSLVL